MRILVDGMPRSMGGIGTLIMNLVQYNEQLGKQDIYQFEFLLPQGSAYKSVLQAKGYPYYEVPKVLTLAYEQAIRKVFSNNQYDFVWINNTSKVNIQLPSIAKEHGTRVIVHSHGVATEATGCRKVLFSLMEKLNSKRYLRLVDIPFACSTQSAKYFYPDDLLAKCKIVPNGIFSEKFMFSNEDREEIRHGLDLLPGDVLLGSVGRLTRVKNYEYIIRMMNQLPENYKYIILGKGENEEEINDLVCSMHLEKRVFLLGMKDRVEKYLSAMDIYLMPSFNEGMPFSLIEAQANGLRCIVSTGITKSADITGNVVFAELDKSGDWFDEIMKSTEPLEERPLANKQVREAGFSVEESYETFISCLT